MTTSEQVYRLIQRQTRNAARADGTRPNVEEQFTRHALESFLERLTRTRHADSFVLKGGVLLAAYGLRRPTKDIDAEALDIPVTPEHLASVVIDVAAVAAGDGVVFDPATTRIERIRDLADYPGIRVHVHAQLHTWHRVIGWDVSTGDAIVPAPRVVLLPRVLGEDLRIVGYAPETVVAEKTVTILERGTTSTRWRDYVDIVAMMDRYPVDPGELVSALNAVAKARRVQLRPIRAVVEGYGAVAQRKWAAWLNKTGLTGVAHSDLDRQLEHVADLVDPYLQPTS
jgi:hypothetical protein